MLGFYCSCVIINCSKAKIILNYASLYFYFRMSVPNIKSRESTISKSTERRAAKSHAPVKAKIF